MWPVTCLATIAYVYAACVVHAIFTTGGKFNFNYVATRSYSNHPIFCNTFKRTREWRYSCMYFWYMCTHKALMLVVRAGWDVNQWRVW